MRRTGLALLGFALLAAQAPRASAGAWLQARGETWVKWGGSLGWADEKFANDELDELKTWPDGRAVNAGDRIPFDFVTGGRYRVRSTTLEIAHGVLDAWEVSAALPWLHTRFDNDVDEVEPGNGIGDLRLGTALRLWADERTVVSASLGWKIPTADVPRSVFAQPLGEGQHDVAVGLRAGRSLWPHGWAQFEVLFRWRGENTELEFDPGNEVHLAAEGGWQFHPRWALKLRGEHMESGKWTSQAFAFEQRLGRRRFTSIAPALLCSLGRGRGTVEVGGAIAVGGEDLPVTHELRIAWMATFGNPP